MDYRQLLIRYMARVIDIESISYVEEGFATNRKLDFEGEELKFLLECESEARKIVNEG